MNSNKRKGRGNPTSSRHLRPSKGQPFSTSGSSSPNWRDFGKNNVNESNNYGYNNHYLTSAFCTLIGLQVKIQKTDGAIYEGILETVSNKLEFHLSHVSKLSVNGTNNNQGDPTEKAMFHFCDVVYCKAVDVDLDFAKRDSLLTDSAISGSNGPIAEKELIEWQPDDNSNHFGTSLDELEMNGNWTYDDMMRANEEKLGVKSTFDSTMSNYMTPIEITDEGKYKEQERRAEQMAREMQKDSRHKELEILDSGADEEELFSSVSRQNTTVVNNNNDSSNNNTATNANNDGFTTYTSKSYRGSRGGKGGTSIVGPRLQRNNRNQELPHRNQEYPHANGNHPGSSRNSIQSRVQNGNRGAYYQPQQSSESSYSNTTRSDSSYSTPKQANVQFPTSNVALETVQQPAKQGLSYSAVAMKKQQLQQQQQQQIQHQMVNRANSGPKPNTALQPLMQQNVSPPLPQNIDNPPLLPNEAVPKLSLSHSCTSPLRTTGATSEALAAAKAQVIQNSKNYATMTQTGLSQQKQPIRPSQILSEQQHHQSIDRQRSIEKKGTVPDQKVDGISFPGKEVKGLVKYGKHQNAGEEEKKPSSLNELKDFSKQFQLSDTKQRLTSPKKPFTKVQETSSKQKNEEKEAIAATEAVTGTHMAHSRLSTRSSSAKPVTTTNTSSCISATTTSSTTRTTVTTVSLSQISTSAHVVSSIPTAVSTTTKATIKSDPAVKEFTFNPTAKEFTPVVKPALAKQSSSIGETPQPIPQQYYTAPVGSQAMPTQHQAEFIQQSAIKQTYPTRYSSTVYSVPVGNHGEYPASNGGAQVIPAQPASGFINQNIHNQMLIIPATGHMQYHQQVVPGPPNQQYIQMQHAQHNVMRYFNAHPASSPVQQVPNRLPSNYPQEGVPQYHLISVSQQQLHQQVACNQHHTLSASTASPSQHLQQYVVNTTNNYPQGGNAQTYRPSTLMHAGTNQHHQQQSFVVMPHQSQHPVHGVSMPTNQQYIPGQQHTGILPNYPQAN